MCLQLDIRFIFAFIRARSGKLVYIDLLVYILKTACIIVTIFGMKHHNDERNYTCEISSPRAPWVW